METWVQYDFPKKQRITESKLFKRRAQIGPFKTAVVWFVLNKNKNSYSRLGMTVSKKSVARAVDRVRIKRLMRESFRHNKQYVAGYDVILIARRGISELDRRALRILIDKQWQIIAEQLS